MKTYTEINKRYSGLADSTCCLSCGGALNFSEAKPGEVCVDLGSGRGTDVIRLADTVGPDGFVFGIDVSEGMIKKAVNTAVSMGIQNVKFVKSTLEKLDLADEIADLVVSNCTINHSSDKKSAWSEVFRVLKKGGRFVVSDIYAVDPIADEYKNDPVAISECWAGSATRGEYLEHLLSAGFKSIHVIEESDPYDKGNARVSSWTISGEKPSSKCNCGCKN